MYYVPENNYKNRESSLFIFGETWMKTLYREFSLILKRLHKFIKNLILIGICSKFLHSIQTCTCMCIGKNYKNRKFFPCHFWCAIVTDTLGKFWNNFLTKNIITSGKNGKFSHSHFDKMYVILEGEILLNC